MRIVYLRLCGLLVACYWVRCAGVATTLPLARLRLWHDELSNKGGLKAINNDSIFSECSSYSRVF